MTTVSNDKAYEKIIRAFKARRKGVTPADVAAATGLSLPTVRELVPKAADEYSGRLEVSESGEILYSFPNGFNSRYRGLGPFARKCVKQLSRTAAAVGTLIFKIWIMVMLIGYFVLFMAIALASVFISMTANSSNNRSRRDSSGGFNFSIGIFNLIMRLWFYSELTKTMDTGSRRSSVSRPPARPLHKAIFSFVFGDGDPNANYPEEQKKTFIAYLRAHQGVISLPEFLTLSGLKPAEAEAGLTRLCVEFGGSPEATEDGTVVYRFDEILLGAEKNGTPGLPLVFKHEGVFSANQGKMNTWFSVINGVNLLFGGYFLYNVINIGNVFSGQTRGIYRLVYTFLAQFTGGLTDPLPLIAVVLGVVPLAFSFLFWLIPLIRRFILKKENRKIRFENFRKFSFSKIWSFPLKVRKSDLTPPYTEAVPENVEAAKDQVIKEMGSYVVPEVSIDESGEVYGFAELDREKQALEKYRTSVNPGLSSLGKIVFDSGQ